MGIYNGSFQIFLLLLFARFKSLNTLESNIQFLYEEQSRNKFDVADLSNETLRWACPLEDSTENLSIAENWYKFLNALYCKFSEYKMQVARNTYKIADTRISGTEACEFEELRDSKTLKIVIDRNNLEIFLNKTEECNINEYGSIRNMNITGFQTEELNHVLDLTLNDRLQVNCVGRYLFIKGQFITTGDVTDILLSRKEIADDKCKDLILSDSSKFINIFALNTFFVDVNIDSSITKLLKIVQISVISPKWQNIGRNKIELRGADGEFPKAGIEIDGKPGKPGGNFFGIGREFISGQNLTISVSGGDGSHGQRGKNGENGRDGFTPRIPSIQSCDEYLCDNNKRINYYKCRKIKCYPHCRLCRLPTGHSCEYKLFGEIGLKGKKGERGGKGGKGGYPGSIILLELINNSDMSLLNNTGINGKSGRGGLGGNGGKKGNDIIVKCSWRRFKDIEWVLLSNVNSNEKHESGEDGADGDIYNDIEKPIAATPITNLDKSKILNQYKIYLRENLSNRFTYYFLKEFLTQLENNVKVKRVYDTLGLIDELQTLEEQFPKLNNDINFLPFYQSLLNRIDNYAKTFNESGDPNHYKKVLQYLYLATLGRMQNVEESVESYLIIDMHAYLKSERENIEKLKQLQNVKLKKELISRYTEEYKREIDIKIKEAKEIISKVITPEIDNIGRNIDIEIDLLLKEVLDLQEQAIIKEEKLIEKQQKLRRALALQKMFSFFKFFGEVLSFLSPVGEIAGSVMAAGSTIAETSILDNAEDQNSVFQLPQSTSEIELIDERIKDIKDKRITCLRKTLEIISLEIIKHTDVLGNLSISLTNIEERLDKIENNNLHFTDIQLIESDLESALQKEEVSEENTVKTLTLIPEIYIKYENSNGNLDAISYALKQNEDKFKNLKLLEKSIYNTVMPMLEDIQNDVKYIISKLDTKSQVTLDVTKWHVTSTLRNMLLLMRNVTQGLEAQDNILRCIEYLEETMITIIDVYGHIQHYQKDKNVANFYEKISSITMTDISIYNNPEIHGDFKTAILDLEIMLRSSIVVQRYKTAIYSFKQFVFPYAHNYFKEFALPSHLKLSDDKNYTTLDDLVYRATVEIEKITSKLEEYKNTLKRRHGCIGIGVFKSGYVSSKPFFVWKNEQHKNLISNLLAGENVIIRADIRSSARDKDAIKFNFIEFHFKAKDEQLHYVLNEKLKGFLITATHLGNSYYRYGNKIYEITTVSQELWYYFEKGPNGEPLDYSLPYKIIKDGNLTLSPYASWKVKLDIVGEDSSFEDLEMYKDSVDLVLEGRGHYINKRSMDCVDLMVDKYYKPIDMYSQEQSNFESNVEAST